MKPHIVVLTGSGISAESGIRTFRDNGGLWEEHRVEDVATPQAFARDPELVLRFYNQRRQQLQTVQPNAAHIALAELEQNYRVSIITQNVDDLHERAGSSAVLHLHGELNKVRSTRFEDLIYERTDDINIGDLCERGHQLRPHIVWFGEAVPMLETAVEIVAQADAVMVIGTSMQVYPAASLIHYAPQGVKTWFVDPAPAVSSSEKLTIVAENASTGVPKAIQLIQAAL